MTAPQFVGIVRQYVPRDGIAHNGKPSRIKSKIKKALDKANIQSETIRGIGRKIGNYALVYEEKGSLLYANFVDFTSLNVEVSKKARGSRRSKKKKVNVLTGPHDSVVDLSLGEYGSQIVDMYFPEEWERKEENFGRWMAFDVKFMYHTGLTIEAAAQNIIQMAKALNQSKIYYTVIFMSDQNVLIGIGPT